MPIIHKGSDTKQVEEEIGAVASRFMFTWKEASDHWNRVGDGE